MGYFENLDKAALNLKTDGEIRYVDGGYTLVPCNKPPTKYSL